MANPSAWRPVPNGRDLRKYARLFLRTDVDSDGFISHADAQAIFNKSALPPEVLGSIFNQANASQSSHMSFPEFVAAMHLIREARQTQQSPVISPEFMGFLSSFYESPNNLATQGSSKSAQAMRQMQSQAPPQVELGAGRDVTVDPAIPEFPSGPSIANFGNDTPQPQFPNEVDFPQDFSQDAHVSFGEEQDARRKDRRDKKKHKDDKKDKSEKKNKKNKESNEEGFGKGEWSTFGQDDLDWGQGEQPEKSKEEGSNTRWPSFGHEEEMSFGLDSLQANAEAPDRSKSKKDKKDSISWERESESISPSGLTDRAADLKTVLPQPRTRFGLPVGNTPGDRDHGDPDYAARLQEILGFSKDRHFVPHKVQEQSNGWAGRRNDGHFEERYRKAYMDLGDYGSPGVKVSLMGLHPTRNAPRVLPEPAKPFLKSLTPNFKADIAGRTGLRTGPNHFSLKSF